VATPYAVHENRLAVLEKRREALDLEILAVKETIELFKAREVAAQSSLGLSSPAKAGKSA